MGLANSDRGRRGGARLGGITSSMRTRGGSADGLSARMLSSAPVQRRPLRDALRQEPLLQRRPSPLQRQAGPGDAGAPVPIPSGGGAPLSPGVRGQMEHGFDADFSDVRVHHGDTADQLGALAFTRGNDIHVGSGGNTRSTLTHELAHVVQQREGRVRATGSVGGQPLNDSGSLEAEADRAADRVLAGGVVQRRGGGGNVGRAGPIQRKLRSSILTKEKKPPNLYVGEEAIKSLDNLKIKKVEGNRLANNSIAVYDGQQYSRKGDTYVEVVYGMKADGAIGKIEGFVNGKWLPKDKEHQHETEEAEEAYKQRVGEYDIDSSSKDWKEGKADAWIAEVRNTPYGTHPLIASRGDGKSQRTLLEVETAQEVGAVPGLPPQVINSVHASLNKERRTKHPTQYDKDDWAEVLKQFVIKTREHRAIDRSYPVFDTPLVEKALIGSVGGQLVAAPTETGSDLANNSDVLGLVRPIADLFEAMVIAFQAFNERKQANAQYDEGVSRTALEVSKAFRALGKLAEGSAFVAKLANGSLPAIGAACAALGITSSGLGLVTGVISMAWAVKELEVIGLEQSKWTGLEAKLPRDLQRVARARSAVNGRQLVNRKSTLAAGAFSTVGSTVLATAGSLAAAGLATGALFGVGAVVAAIGGLIALGWAVYSLIKKKEWRAQYLDQSFIDRLDAAAKMDDTTEAEKEKFQDQIEKLKEGDKETRDQMAIADGFVDYKTCYKAMVYELALHLHTEVLKESAEDTWAENQANVEEFPATAALKTMLGEKPPLTWDDIQKITVESLAEMLRI